MSNVGKCRQRREGLLLFADVLTNDSQTGRTHLPRPAIQCTAMQPFGSSLKRQRNTSKNCSITSTGGPMPSSNGKSFSQNNIQHHYQTNAIYALMALFLHAAIAKKLIQFVLPEYTFSTLSTIHIYFFTLFVRGKSIKIHDTARTSIPPSKI